MSFLNPYNAVTNSNGTNPSEETDNVSSTNNVVDKGNNNSQKLVAVEIPVATDGAHGSGCAHCMSNFISQKTVMAKPGQVASLKSNAATQAFGKARENMLADTWKHENAHFARASAAGLNPSPPVVNADGSGSVSFQMPTLTDPNAKTKLQGAVEAALAPDNPSAQDHSVAAKAQSLLAQLGGKDTLAKTGNNKSQLGGKQAAGNILSATNRALNISSGLAV